MTRQIQHSLLGKAKKNKKDEFYTQLIDIERELKFYKNHFSGKIVYCNCDDATISNFYKYFSSHFDELGLKKLICACYRENKTEFFCSKLSTPGKYYIYSGKGKQIPDEKDLIPFNGDGDFRSSESIELLKQSDIVVTNPPFSLFREYLGQLLKYKKKFLVIANVNAITYKEVFYQIKENNIWLGINLGRGISGFIVPHHYELYGTEAKIDKLGNRIISTNNCLWLTNIDNFQRHKYITLTKTYKGNEEIYKKYDNYNAININKTEDIPVDYNGAMGVPITFLHKFNPDQFEIIKFRKGDDDKDLSINGKCPYFRILIRKKIQNNSPSENLYDGLEKTTAVPAIVGNAYEFIGIQQGQEGAGRIVGEV